MSVVLSKPYFGSEHSMHRIEYKYLVPNEKLLLVRRFLAPYVKMDIYADQQEGKAYSVRSIYYDTARLDFYHQKLAGIKNRRKVRIRGYNDFSPESLVFLEIKRKNEAVISKNRSAVVFNELVSLLKTGDVKTHVFSKNGTPNGHENARKFLFQVHRCSLRPVINVIYEREAYFYKFNHRLRITLDKNLRSTLHSATESLFEEENVRCALPGYSIMEIKSNGGLPAWLGYLIGRGGFRLQALSKYSICVDSYPRRFVTPELLVRHRVNSQKTRIRKYPELVS